MTDPKHPEDLSNPDDPDSPPMLTDVLVPGRPAMPRPAAQPEHATQPEHPTQPQPSMPSMHESPRPAEAIEARDPRPVTEQSTEAVRAAQLQDFVEPVAAAPSVSAGASAETSAEARTETSAEAPAAAPAESVPEPISPPAPAVELPASADLSERDAEQLAERLRVRFAGYLREEGRAVIEARCREALQEHTSWLVRQVTREVALALEGEVVGWVRDAVREELAAHRASRRPGA